MSRKYTDPLFARPAVASISGLINHDPGHYLDTVCTILLGYEPGSNWAYYGAAGPEAVDCWADRVQSRAVVPGCRSSAFGGRGFFRDHLRTRPGIVLTVAGNRWLEGVTS